MEKKVSYIVGYLGKHHKSTVPCANHMKSFVLINDCLDSHFGDDFAQEMSRLMTKPTK